MTIPRALRAVLSTSTLAACALALSACGGGGSSTDASPATPDAPRVVDASAPDAARPDAAAIDRACPADPTEIPVGTESLTLSGLVEQVDGEPIVGATVDVFVAGVEAAVGSAVTGDDGRYAVAVPVTEGGPALLAHAVVRHADYVTNFIYPPDPIAADIAFNPVMIDRAALGLLYTVLGGTARLDTHSTVATLVLDCAFAPINDASVTFAPAAGTVLYLNFTSALPSVELDGTTGPSGLALALNVPLGVVSVGGTYAGTALESHEIGTFVDGKDFAMTTTLVHPVPAAP